MFPCLICNAVEGESSSEVSSSQPLECVCYSRQDTYYMNDAFVLEWSRIGGVGQVHIEIRVKHESSAEYTTVYNNYTWVRSNFQFTSDLLGLTGEDSLGTYSFIAFFYDEEHTTRISKGSFNCVLSSEQSYMINEYAPGTAEYWRQQASEGSVISTLGQYIGDIWGAEASYPIEVPFDDKLPSLPDDEVSVRPTVGGIFSSAFNALPDGLIAIAIPAVVILFLGWWLSK